MRNRNICYLLVSMTCVMTFLAWQRSNMPRHASGDSTRDKIKQLDSSQELSKPLSEDRMNDSRIGQILNGSRTKRESGGAPSIDVLWYADTEKDLMVWAKSINAIVTDRIRKNKNEIIVLNGFEGSGIIRVTVYVFAKESNAEFWHLVLVLPTQSEFVSATLDKKNILVLKSGLENVVGTVSVESIMLSNVKEDS